MKGINTTLGFNNFLYVYFKLLSIYCLCLYSLYVYWFYFYFLSLSISLVLFIQRFRSTLLVLQLNCFSGFVSFDSRVSLSQVYIYISIGIYSVPLVSF